jgi:hypothetical protein
MCIHIADAKALDIFSHCSSTTPNPSTQYSSIPSPILSTSTHLLVIATIAFSSFGSICLYLVSSLLHPYPSLLSLRLPPCLPLHIPASHSQETVLSPSPSIPVSPNLPHPSLIYFLGRLYAYHQQIPLSFSHSPSLSNFYHVILSVYVSHLNIRLFNYLLFILIGSFSTLLLLRPSPTFSDLHFLLLRLGCIIIGGSASTVAEYLCPSSSTCSTEPAVLSRGTYANARGRPKVTLKPPEVVLPTICKRGPRLVGP